MMNKKEMKRVGYVMDMFTRLLSVFENNGIQLTKDRNNSRINLTRPKEQTENPLFENILRLHAHIRSIRITLALIYRFDIVTRAGALVSPDNGSPDIYVEVAFATARTERIQLTTFPSTEEGWKFDAPIECLDPLIKELKLCFCGMEDAELGEIGDREVLVCLDAAARMLAKVES